MTHDFWDFCDDCNKRKCKKQNDNNVNVIRRLELKLNLKTTKSKLQESKFTLGKWRTRII